ncbi:MAG: hypothetical protein KF858_00195 [Candidatus Sumerlaeia bacterium]|nr:hypothetical protein [Candidatus Sumerlaeia bacterium]
MGWGVRARGDILVIRAASNWTMLACFVLGGWALWELVLDKPNAMSGPYLQVALGIVAGATFLSLAFMIEHRVDPLSRTILRVFTFLGLPLVHGRTTPFEEVRHVELRRRTDIETVGTRRFRVPVKVQYFRVSIQLRDHREIMVIDTKDDQEAVAQAWMLARALNVRVNNR